jgi:hypothetical protein
MAHKKGEGKVKNGRESESKRLGIKDIWWSKSSCWKHYCSSARHQA